MAAFHIRPNAGSNTNQVSKVTIPGKIRRTTHTAKYTLRPVDSPRRPSESSVPRNSVTRPLGWQLHQTLRPTQTMEAQLLPTNCPTTIGSSSKRWRKAFPLHLTRHPKIKRLTIFLWTLPRISFPMMRTQIVAVTKNVDPVTHQITNYWL